VACCPMFDWYSSNASTTCIMQVQFHGANTNTWCQTTRERNRYMYWTQYNMAIRKQANTNSFEMGVKVWWQQSHTYEYVKYKCVTLFVFGDDCQQQINEEIAFNFICFQGLDSGWCCHKPFDFFLTLTMKIPNQFHVFAAGGGGGHHMKGDKTK
jgi:hypothetical protein